MIDEEKIANMNSSMNKLNEQIKKAQLSSDEWNNALKGMGKIVQEWTRLNEVWKNNLLVLGISREFQNYAQMVKDAEGLSEDDFKDKFSSELEQSKK